MVPSWNFTVRPASFEAAPVAEANVDALDSDAIIALTVGRDEPSAAPPSVEMNRRLPVSTAIASCSTGSCPLQCRERYHTLIGRSVTYFAVRQYVRLWHVADVARCPT